MNAFPANMQSRLAQVSEQYQLHAILLFGSQSRRRARSDSDVDIAVLPVTPLSSDEEDRLYVDVADALRSDRLDLVNLDTAPLLLKFAVIRHGTCLVCTNAAALTQFIVATRRDYLDTQHIRNIFAQYQSQRISSGCFGASR